MGAQFEETNTLKTYSKYCTIIAQIFSRQHLTNIFEVWHKYCKVQRTGSSCQGPARRPRRPPHNLAWRPSLAKPQIRSEARAQIRKYTEIHKFVLHHLENVPQILKMNWKILTNIAQMMHNYWTNVAYKCYTKLHKVEVQQLFRWSASWVTLGGGHGAIILYYISYMYCIYIVYIKISSIYIF